MGEYLDIIKELSASHANMTKVMVDLQKKAEDLTRTNLRLVQLISFCKALSKPEIRN